MAIHVDRECTTTSVKPTMKLFSTPFAVAFSAIADEAIASSGERLHAAAAEEEADKKERQHRDDNKIMFNSMMFAAVIKFFRFR